ncbi:MAG TPA: hypothetical protein VLD61_01940, partial [Methylomirabilota bacterium]|nr:hypothetical protein [Methylomirabilota bacterium]
MRELIESVALEGTTLVVRAREPLPVELPTLLVGTAMRAFERHSVLRRVALTTPSAELSVSREEIERGLAPEGFAALREWGRWRQA